MTRPIEAYPLTWPAGWPRHEGERERAKFGRREHRESQYGGSGYSVKRELTIADGVVRLRDELDRLGADEDTIVISTNVPTRRDGLPLGKAANPADPGAAVYFRLEGMPVSLACDKWDRLADNLAAIAAHIEALRAQERWGVGRLTQAFAGYKQLAAVGESKPWWQVLGFTTKHVDRGVVDRRVRELRMQHHPDRGGNANQMAEINAAYNEAQAEWENTGRRSVG